MYSYKVVAKRITMTLQHEIELNRDFRSPQEEALLAFIWTYQKMSKMSTDFFKRFDLTETQFNALMIVADYQEEGIRQFELARRLLINRASTGALIDALEAKGWLQRVRAPDDRRAYRLILTGAGSDLLHRFKPAYYALVNESMAGFEHGELRQLTDLLGKFRNGFTQVLASREETHV
jgi:DNA-binding MarR family transcriptional regulator